MRRFLATIRRNRWGLLFEEFRAYGWRPAKVDPRTGKPSDEKNAVWVMRHTGEENDEALLFARRVATVTVRSRPLGVSEM